MFIGPPGTYIETDGLVCSLFRLASSLTFLSVIEFEDLLWKRDSDGSSARWDDDFGGKVRMGGGSKTADCPGRLTTI